MPALWRYPWDLYAEGLSTTCAELESRGITGLNVAVHYHSVRSMCPRTPDRLFESYPGGCYVPADSPRFEDTPIDPIPNRVDGVDDPSGGSSPKQPITASRPTRGSLGCTTLGWVPRIRSTGLRARSVTPTTISLCPSHPEVHEYFGATMDSVAAWDVDEIQLESLGFPSAFHGHGREFGHDKRQALVSQTGKALVSQCFCEGCRNRAREHHIDLDAARALVRERLQRPDDDAPPLEALVREEDVLRDLFDFRRTVIEEFVTTLSEAAGDVPLNYYVMEWPGFEPGDGWPAGVHLADLDGLVDRMTALCYASDPAVARQRIRSLRCATSYPVDAGVTLDHAVAKRRDAFDAVATAVRGEAIGTSSVYHHSLLTAAHLKWVRDAFVAG